MLKGSRLAQSLCVLLPTPLSVIIGTVNLMQSTYSTLDSYGVVSNAESVKFSLNARLWYTSKTIIQSESNVQFIVTIRLKYKKIAASVSNYLFDKCRCTPDSV